MKTQILALVMVVWFSLGGCAPGSLVPVTSKAGVTPSLDEALLVDAREYARLNGVGIDEATHRLQLQGEFGALGAKLEQEQADSFAGLWISHQPSFGVTVAFTLNGEQTIRPYLEGKPWHI